MRVRERFNITYSARGFDVDRGGRHFAAVHYGCAPMTREASAEYAFRSGLRMFGKQLGHVVYGPTKA